MISKLVSDKYIDKALGTIFNRRNYLEIMLYIWLVLFFILPLLTFVEPLGKTVENILGVEIIIPVMFIFFLIITILLCFTSPISAIYRQKNIREELHSYNEYITRYSFLSDAQINQIHKNSHFFTKDFQKYLLTNTLSNHDAEVLKEVLCIEIKNHVLKDGLLWQFFRVFTGIFGYLGFSTSWLATTFLLGSDFPRNALVIPLIVLASIMTLSYLLFICHMYICGYFTRKKIKSTSFPMKILPSPWEYYEEIPIRNQ